jgi:transposase-like protein
MGKGFRKFDQSTRDQAVIDFLESNESAEEIGRRYDTSGTSISHWA